LLPSSCDKHINFPRYENTTTNLAKHVATCLEKKQDKVKNHKLVSLGVSGTGDIDPGEASHWNTPTLKSIPSLTQLSDSTGSTTLCDLVH
jgi:predicted NBD/HSP70 family sugar kinase